MKSPALRPFLKQPAVRFILTGISNTIFGYSVILLFLWQGAGDYIANAIGYACGLSFSYFVNRSWSFGMKTKANPVEVFKFIASFLISYMINLIVLMVCQKMGFVNNPLAHLAAMSAYTIAFYLLSKYLVFPMEHVNRTEDDGRDKQAEPIYSVSKLPVEWAVIAFALVLLPFLLNIPLTHDVSWQFWIARQINAGTPLYGHIMEINPPLWFWIGAVLSQIGDAIAVQPLRLYVGFITGSAVVSVAVFIRLADLPNRSSELLGSIFLLTLLLIAPIYNFGQREQLAAICALPYIALIGKRANHRSVPRYLSFTVGMFAAVGFAMKHYFALVPIGLELWLLFELRKNWRPIRLETSALACCAVAYVGAILFFTPDFVKQIVPLVAAAYGGYERPFIVQVLREEVMIWILVLLWIGWQKFSQPALPKIPLLRALIVASIGFILAYFAQQKGWQYHAIPATVCLSLAMFVWLLNQPSTAGRTLFQKFAQQPFPSVIAITFLLVGAMNGTYKNARDGVEKYYSRLSATDSVMIVTGDPRLVFPHVEKYDVKWTSRHFAHWMLSAIAKAENSGASTEALEQVGSQIRDQLVEDISCHSPEYIYVNVRQIQYGIADDMFRMTDFFSRNDEFADILANHYRLTFKDRNFEIYEAKSKVNQKAGTVCYPIA